MKKKYVFDDKALDDQIREIIERTDADLPVFADNAAAVAGGLKPNQRYRTATGVRMVVYE